MTAPVLVFRAPTLERLRAELLADAPLETAAYAFARAVKTTTGNCRLIVHDSYVVPSADYDRRSEVGIDFPPRVVNAALKHAASTQSALILVHSHPGFDPKPSSRDRSGESLVVPAFQRRVPNTPIARLILSPTRLSAALLDPLSGDLPLDVHEIGSDLHIHRHCAASASAAPDIRFDRQVRAFGPDGQRLLRSLRVAIIGLGGTGSVVAQQLAYLGIHTFLLIDPEIIEPTNLNRVVGATRANVGEPKVDVAAAMIRTINPDANVTPLRADIRDRDTLRRLLDSDVFLACTDSQGSRAVLTQLAYQYLVPGFDMGVVIHAGADNTITHVSGRVQMLAPGLACLLCSAVLDPEAVRRDLLTDEARAADPYIVGGVAPQPAVISINSATASLAVTMLLSAVTGVPVAARHQRLRLETGVVSRVETTPAPSCPWCSAAGALARCDSWAMPGRAT